MAIALLALGMADWSVALPRLLTFWGMFWIGLVVAVLALSGRAVSAGFRTG